jgi:PAS domain S-box-containing protein
MKFILTRPDLHDEEQNRLALILHTFLILMLITSVLIIIVCLINRWYISLYILSATALTILISLILTYRGKVQSASNIVLISLLCAISISAYKGDGIHDISALTIPIMIIIASLLLVRKTFFLFTALTVMAIGAVEYFRFRNSQIQLYGDDPLSEYMILVLVLLITAAMVRLLTENMIATIRRVKESEIKYRNIFENIQDIYYESKPDGTLSEVGYSLEKILGYSRDELINRSMVSLYQNPEQHTFFINQLLQHNHIANYELPILDKQRNLHYMSINATLLRDDDGIALKIFGSMRDVTEKKLLTEQLIQAQKMESLGQLAGGIAHDFNNLLTVINGHCEIASLKLKTNDPEIRKDLAAIQAAGTRATKLTQQILAFSRKQIIEPRIVDLNQLITNLDTMLYRLLDADISLELKLHPELPKIKADPNQIEQIIINLIVNAKDALKRHLEPSATKLIIMATSPLTIDEQFQGYNPEIKKGQFIVLSIQDTGIGIDKTILNNIFEPFFTTKEKGTGLGLSMVYGIVKQNNGFITVQSTPGHGSIFEIYWPTIN